MSAAPLSDAQFAELLRVIRETVRAEVRAEFEGRRVRPRPTNNAWHSEGMVI